MSNAVIYCRVSTKEQTQNLSLSTQLKACRDYCRREGHRVVAEFTDAGESAKTTDRPKFLELVSFCRDRKNRVSFVVVYNLTRFSRNALDFSLVRGLLQGVGVSLRSVNEPLSEDPVGNLTGNILAAIAQFDNDEKARRTKTGMKASLELGRWPFKAPLGYVNDPNRRGYLLPHPTLGPLVVSAFESFSSGLHTAREALALATNLGLRTEKGRPVSGQTFNKLLRNGIYAGRLSVPTWTHTSNAAFLPLVSPELFDRVQYVLAGRHGSTVRRKRDHADFPLRRFVRCAHCDNALTASWSKGRNRKYAYYHCPKCRSVKVRKDFLEERFLAELDAVRPSSGFMRLFHEVVLDVWERRHAEARRNRERLEATLGERRRRLERVEEAFLYEQAIDRETYESQRNRLREEIAIGQMQLNEATADEFDVEGLLRFAEHLLNNAGRLWSELQLDGKRQLQAVIFPKGLRFDGTAFGTTVTCLAFSQLGEKTSEEGRLASPPGFEPGF